MRHYFNLLWVLLFILTCIFCLPSDDLKLENKPEKRNADFASDSATVVSPSETAAQAGSVDSPTSNSQQATSVADNDKPVDSDKSPPPLVSGMTKSSDLESVIVSSDENMNGTEEKASTTSSANQQAPSNMNDTATTSDAVLSEVQQDHQVDKVPAVLLTTPVPAATNETPDNEKDSVLDFDEWTKHKMEEQLQIKTVSQAIGIPSPTDREAGGTPVAVTSRNYASHDCGAKVLLYNTEAKNAKSILNEKDRDEYMLNPCQTESKWFVVELCESIQLKRFDIANFELFSSSPKTFRLFASERYPSPEWTLLGEYTAEDRREIQSFDVASSVFSKVIKVELLSHYGKEHFCPVSLIRAFGISMVDEYEQDALMLAYQNNVKVNTSLKNITTETEESADRIDSATQLDEDVVSEPSNFLVKPKRRAILHQVVDIAKDFLSQAHAVIASKITYTKSSQEATVVNKSVTPSAATCENMQSGLFGATVPKAWEFCFSSYPESSCNSYCSFVYAFLPVPSFSSICRTSLGCVSTLEPSLQLPSRTLEDSIDVTSDDVSTGNICSRDELFIPKPVVVDELPSPSSINEPPEISKLDVEARSGTGSRLPEPTTPSDPQANAEVPTEQRASSVSSEEQKVDVEVWLSESASAPPIVSPTNSAVSEMSPENLTLDTAVDQTTTTNQDVKNLPTPYEIINPAIAEEGASTAAKNNKVTQRMDTGYWASKSKSFPRYLSRDYCYKHSLHPLCGGNFITPITRKRIVSAKSISDEKHASAATADENGSRTAVHAKLQLPEKQVQNDDSSANGNNSNSTNNNAQVNFVLPNANLAASGGIPLPGSSTGQKESIFLRLNNRIKILELNISLSSQYLNELSRRYRKQMEDMQRSYNRTNQMLNDNLAYVEAAFIVQKAESDGLREELKKVVEMLNAVEDQNLYIMGDLWKWHIVIITVEVVFLMLILGLCLMKVVHQWLNNAVQREVERLLQSGNVSERLDSQSDDVLSAALTDTDSSKTTFPMKSEDVETIISLEAPSNSESISMHVQRQRSNSTVVLSSEGCTNSTLCDDVFLNSTVSMPTITFHDSTNCLAPSQHKLKRNHRRRGSKTGNVSGSGTKKQRRSVIWSSSKSSQIQASTSSNALASRRSSYHNAFTITQASNAPSLCLAQQQKFALNGRGVQQLCDAKQQLRPAASVHSFAQKPSQQAANSNAWYSSGGKGELKKCVSLENCSLPQLQCFNNASTYVCTSNTSHLSIHNRFSVLNVKSAV